MYNFKKEMRAAFSALKNVLKKQLKELYLSDCLIVYEFCENDPLS